jgi:Ca2+-binding RTX toxin-like protein
VLQGPDSVTIGDLSDTAVRAVDVDLTDGDGQPDANGDRVTLNGAGSANLITLAQAADGRIGIVDTAIGATVVTTVTGLNSEDQLVLATGGGDDFVRIKGAVGNVQLLVQAGDGDDEIIMGIGSSTALGGAGNDIIRGAAGRNILSGNDGDDLLVSADGVIALGGAGNDTIQGHALDVLEGDDGDDVISVGASTRANGGAGADSFTAGSDAGGAQVTGGDGDDLFVGTSGNLIFHGDDGDDSMVWDMTGPSSSNTLLEGGAGSDAVRISGPQDDVAWQITVGNNGTGFELVQLTHNAPGAAIDARMFTQNVERLAIQGGRGGDTIVVNDQTGLGVQQLDIDLGAAASGGADGQHDSLTLNATSGADVIAAVVVDGNLAVAGLPVTATVSNLDHSAAVSDAVLIATGARDDRIDLSGLSGFEGVVTVDGGLGNDTVVGGEAGFTYVFHDDGSDDLILGFDAGSDRINLVDRPDSTFKTLMENLHIAQVGVDVVIDDGAGSVLTLANTSLESLGASDFLFG